MNYSPYPITDSNFNKTGEKNVFKKSSQNCYPTQGYITKEIPSIDMGFHKPLSGNCTLITGQLSKGPTEVSSVSPWNNMTKRKSIVKVY